MEIDIKLYPDKFCRTCLRESVQMRPLSGIIDGENKTLLDALHFVANINVFVENPLPKQVCSDCEGVLRTADAFKRRCLESEGILTRIFEFSTHSDLPGNNSTNHHIKSEKYFDVSLLDSSKSHQPSNSRKRSSKREIKDIFDNLEKSDIKILKVYSHGDGSGNEDSKTNLVRDSVKEEHDFDVYDDDMGHAEVIEPLEHSFIDEKPLLEEVTVFSCSCGTIFNNKDEYRLHLYKKCSGSTKSRKVLVKKKKSAPTKEITCDICSDVFKTEKLLNIHVKKHKKEVKDDEKSIFECTFCLRKFNRKSSWTNHMRNHTEKNASKKFICETCKREFQHKAHLDNHILAVHSRSKGFLCEICMTNFTTQETLDLHKESHNIEKKHQCEICKKAFIMLSTLNDHMRVHTGEKPFLCSTCGRGFSQKTNLAQHLRRHQGVKPFKCEDCDRRFVSKGELVAHGRKHSGAHPFRCDECRAGFTTSSSLVKHRRTHTGERPYACDLCPMRFAASGTLKNHRRTHTGEKPYQCSYCEKAFVQKHDLVAHIRGHTGERPYTCECGQAFRKASALKAHARLHSKDGAQRDLTLLQPPPMLLGMGHPPV